MSTIPGLEVYKVYNRHHSQQDSILCSQYFFKIKVDYYYILACHIVILLYLRTFAYFNKRIYTFYIVVLVVYSLIWQTTMPSGWCSEHLHHLWVFCMFLAFSGMALVATLEKLEKF